MRRRALLIGSALRLGATTNDVAAMRGELEAFGVECQTLTEGAATRAGILSAFDDLIDSTAPGDASIFYYSGHGGLAPNPRFSPARIGQLPKSFRYLLPIDFEQSAEGDFRGITNHELGWRIDQLTARTENVTVVLDCCHAARLTRGPGDPRVKSWASPPRGIGAHLASLEAQGLDTSRDGRRATRTVCISACSEQDSAYEYTTQSGLRISVMTRFLCQGLALARGTHVDWRNLVARVRELVASDGNAPGQRPVVEGAALRRLFSLFENDSNGILTVSLGPSPRLAGGSLLGVQPGDRFVLEAPVVPGELPERFAVARVTDVDGSSAGFTLEPDLVAPDTELPPHTLARPLKRHTPSLPIHVELEARGREDLELVVASCPELCLVTEARAHQGVVRLNANERRIWGTDARGATLFARPRDPTLRSTIEALLPFARAHALALVEGNSPTIDREFELGWGALASAGTRSLPLCGARLRPGERFFVSVTNHAQHSLWVSFIEIGVAADRRFLNAAYAPEGWELGPDATFVLGEHDGHLAGISSSWPESLDRTVPRPVTLLVVASNQPHDLRSIEGAGVRSAGNAPPSTDLEFAVAKLSFWLDAQASD